MQFDDVERVFRTSRAIWHGRAQRIRDWLKKVQKPNIGVGHSSDRPKKSCSEVIHLDCIVLGINETHIPIGKLGMVHLELEGTILPCVLLKLDLDCATL